MRVPMQTEAIARRRTRSTPSKRGVLPQGCAAGQTLCSCPFSNDCCSPGSTCNCVVGIATCS